MLDRSSVMLAELLVEKPLVVFMHNLSLHVNSIFFLAVERVFILEKTISVGKSRYFCRPQVCFPTKMRTCFTSTDSLLHPHCLCGLKQRKDQTPPGQCASCHQWVFAQIPSDIEDPVSWKRRHQRPHLCFADVERGLSTASERHCATCQSRLFIKYRRLSLCFG